MKKNNKGFTLIELLAVIVVLAIIMVIATTQINGVIRKNRVDSFLSTYKIAMDAAKTCAVQQTSGNDCVANVDYSTDDYVLEMTSNDYEVYKIKLTATKTGEFGNINIGDYYTNDEIPGELGTNDTRLDDVSVSAADNNNGPSLSAEYSVVERTTTASGA